VAEGAGLLNRYTVKSRIGGSNPPLSAIRFFSLFMAREVFDFGYGKWNQQMRYIVLFFLFILGMAENMVCANVTDKPSAAETLQNLTLRGLSPEAQNEKATRAEQQKAIDIARQEALSTISYLRVDATTKLQEVNIAQLEVQRLKKEFLYAKNLDARDPWREFRGQKKFVMSLGAGVVQFRGQVQDVTTNGIRILGQMGDATSVEYFVVNFPFPLEPGENVDPTKIYVAFAAGTLTYETDDGYLKTVPKLDYGKPCAKPKDADVVELAAQKLTPEEQAELKAAELDATQKMDVAATAQKRLLDFQNRADAEWKTALDKLHQDQEALLKQTREQADKGDAAALRRMGERYRDGDGVEKNFVKAAEFFRKFDAAAKPVENPPARSVP
jgi:hypothetical protein